MEILESRRAESHRRGFEELQDAPRPVVRLRNRIASVTASRDRMRVCVRTRADEGSVARSAGTVLCRTQGGWFGMGGISRFPAFSGESMGHERNRSADRSGIVGTSGYHDDDAVLALRAESRGEKYPGGASG